MGHSTSSGRNNAPEITRRIQRDNLAREDAENVAAELRTMGYETYVTGEGQRRSVVAQRRANFEDEIDRASFSGNGNIKSFNLPGIGGASVTLGRDEAGTRGWVARVWTPNSNANPINGGRAFSSQEDAMNAARRTLKNRARVQRTQTVPLRRR